MSIKAPKRLASILNPLEYLACDAGFERKKVTAFGGNDAKALEVEVVGTSIPVHKMFLINSILLFILLVMK